jgi:hypothetical protein
LLRNSISRWVWLGGACLLAIALFFFWHIPSGHDFEFHVFSWMDVLGQWKHGIAYPRWAGLAQWGYGEARFLFYPPASWTLGAALGAILPWKMVPGTYCWIALTLAGAAMYRLAREWLPAADALFAAVFYALNPYHLVIVYWRSAYAELLAAALLPLLLLCILRLDQPGGRTTLWLSLVLVGAWLTNIPAAVMIHYSTAGLALLVCASKAVNGLAGRTASERSWDAQIWYAQIWRPLLRTLVRTALAVLLGAGLASFYLLPAIYEQRWINLDQVMSPGVRPQDNFLFTTIADSDHNRFNLLLSSVALAEIGVLVFAIWGSRRWRTNRLQSSTGQNPWMPLAAWGTGSVLLMLSLSNLLWQHLPKLRFAQLPFHWLLCMNAALAMLLTMATRRWTARLLASGILLATVIVAGYRLQPPWWDTAADIREMSTAVADGSGYEGTDEYVPAGADSSELNKALPRVSDDSGAPVRTRIFAWAPTEKHFMVQAAAPQNVIVRLFSYPAWQVVVNGKPVATQKTEATGLIVIPIAPGESDIYIYFRRTIDRLVGGIVSLFSFAVLIIAWVKTRPLNARPAKSASPAA